MAFVVDVGILFCKYSDITIYYADTVSDDSEGCCKHIVCGFF